VGTLAVFKSQCGDGGSGDSMVYEDVLLLGPVLYLVGDDEGSELDCILEVRYEVILAKIWDHIVFFLFVEFFVIDFTIVEIPSVVISKKIPNLHLLPEKHLDCMIISHSIKDIAGMGRGAMGPMAPTPCQFCFMIFRSFNL
jgi:hypothetical protein